MKSAIEKFGGFLQTIGRSCYDMEFYRAVRTRPVMRAISYFACFAALLAVLGAAIYGPAVFTAGRELREWIDARLADGATLTLRDGKLSSNISEPTDFGSDGKLVLDTGVEGSSFPEDKYPKADIVIGRDAAFFRKDANEQRTYLLGDYPDLSWNKEDIVSRFDRYGLLFAIGIVLFSALLYWLFFVLGMAAYVAVVSLLALMAGKIWKVGMDFGQWAAVGFHALTLPILVDIVLDSIDLHIPFSFSFIFVLFIGAIIADERTAPAGPVVPPAAPPPAAAASVVPVPPKVKKIAAKPREPRKKKTPPTPPLSG